MVEEFPGSTSNLAKKAVLLLGEVLEAANRLLPLSYAAKIQVCTHKLACTKDD
jgi:hypothetical protein